MSQIVDSFLNELCNNISEQSVKDFCKALYHDVPLDTLSLIDAENLAEACYSSFNLLGHRPSYATNIQFLKLTNTPDLRVLEIVTQDVPFLVESISNELKKHDITIHLIVHPSISVERKKSGELISIGKSKTSKEAVMQFFISDHFSEEYYAKLKSEIRKVIECVNVVVEDWKPMQQQMKEAIKNVNAKNWHKSSAIEKKESVQFLEWLLDNHFIFLGSVIVNYEAGKAIIDADYNLGMTKSDLYRNEISIEEIDTNNHDAIFIKKSNSRSVVHRDSYMNCVQIKQFDKANNCNAVIIFLGFFTSSVYMESVRNIPLIRTKINNILQRYGYNEDTYNAKELVTALEGFSRSDLVQMTEEEIFEISTGMVSLNLMPRVKVFLRQDYASQLVHCFVFIPKAKFSAEIMKTVERIISQQIYGTVSRYYVNVGESPLAKLQIVIKPIKGLKKEYNVKKIEELVSGATSVWLDDLLTALQIKHQPGVALEKFNKFKNAFDLKYTSSFAAKQAVHDIKMAELAISENHVKFDFYLSAKSGNDLLQLKIFSPFKELPLSSTLPIIENFGFFVVDTLTFKLSLEQSTKENHDVFIHHFRVSTNNKQIKPLAPSVKKNVEIGLEKIYQHQLDDDKFNALMVYSNLCWQEVVVMRAYASYLKQIGFTHNNSVIAENLINYPELTNKLIEIFNIKFSIGEKNLEHRKQVIKTIVDDIKAALADIPSLITDQIFKIFIELLLATKRTNFFQKVNKSLYTGLAFKIASEEISILPLPKPFREIFVYSDRFEAIHLRGGKIARGGLRWSDRKDDFRTEVLGLMKAQMTKNSVIVPVGSKGGFIVKHLTPASPDFLKEGIECYKNFLRSVLDLTDNVINNKIVTPSNTITYDEEDPYLVVAADKGTASFSDYANSVSQEYSFWLGDAFASGGSAGYDHKKMAITARGAWVSAQDHASQFGINISKQPFTAVGVGDMSGDVFGNGLLMSDQYKLIAAFNHMHIFIDPNPEPQSSFQERKRLFNLPRSQWSDYDSKSISKGGGVFLRSAKSIELSPEASKALGCDENKSVTPDELVQIILKAPVDILWNGGIGTYIKSSEEANSMIGDKNNDNVRINGKDLRCKAVIEGGNLGVTQLGRIEYAKNHGRINTDFIDNSAGVDCSDHEVNIKIAFADLMQKKSINLEERNQILVKMTDEVAELVLRDNKNQTLLISLEQHYGRKRLDEHFWLIKNLEARKELNRELEKLPPAEDFTEIANLFGKLSRPEISVLIAYAKNSAIATTMHSTKTLDQYLDSYLINYFPITIQQKFHDALAHHKLKKEIIVTSVVNHFVNTLGCCLFHQLIEQGHDAVDIMHAFVISADLLSLEKLWSETEQLTHTITARTQLSLFHSITQSVTNLLLWILKHKNLLGDCANSIEKLRTSLDDLAAFHQPSQKDTKLDHHELSKITNKSLVASINSVAELTAVLDIIKISQDSGKSIKISSTEYQKICKTLGVQQLLEQIHNVEVFDYAENTAMQAILSDLNHLLSTVTTSNLKKDILSTQHQKTENISIFLHDLAKNITPINVVSIMVIALQRLKEVIN